MYLFWYVTAFVIHCNSKELRIQLLLWHFHDRLTVTSWRWFAVKLAIWQHPAVRRGTTSDVSFTTCLTVLSIRIQLLLPFHANQKNAPTLESCSLDRHSLFLMIFGKQHQHTFGNDIHIQLSLSLHFCLVYLLVSSCGGNDATTATGSSSSLTHWHCKRRRRSCCNGQWRKRLR